MSATVEVDQPCPSATDGEIAAINLESVRHPEAQSQIRDAMKRGFQTRDAEMDLGKMIGDLADH